ncbi:serine hydrolase domain-containing protein [Archangium primigenium]|uniref:serine hydrolase domain-containing protein n=1 Tax=[Archangium] primigenium TaxID=2792470 RepID=UPI001959DD1A|nr:serine hydrolase domain-containing protein [Archangium primigenium]MBM7116456.1 beta-lactamase family protein [Archangium primigenium]
MSVSRRAVLVGTLGLAGAACSSRRGRARHEAEALVRAQAFNGVVLLGEGDRVVHAWGEGMADFEAGVPSTPGTKYQMGSLSKWIASIVVLQLVDAGVLSLTAPIGDYLPDYRRDTGAKLTLHHLLSHTSGVPNALAVALRETPELAAFMDVGLDEAVARYASGDLVFEPGTRFDYAHSNWLLVQAILERVTHQPYREAVPARLFAPLRLEDSGILHGDILGLPGMAQGYGTLVPTPTRTPASRVSPMPDILTCVGGFYATAPDLLRLMEAVIGGDVLSRASRERLGTVVVPEEDYAYGGRVRTRTLGGRARRVFWNTGSNGAYKTLSVHTEDGKSVVLLNNTRADLDVINTLGAALLELLYR